jgi:hypothetical protein
MRGAVWRCPPRQARNRDTYLAFLTGEFGRADKSANTPEIRLFVILNNNRIRRSGSTVLTNREG